MFATKRALIVLLAVVALGLVLTGCQQGGTDTVKIGVNMELSAVATYGQSTVDGIELAIDEVNAAGGIDGKQVELRQARQQIGRGRSDHVATKLMSEDDVAGVLGPATSELPAEIPVANDNKVPVISGPATADDGTVDASGVKEYAFRICFNDFYQGTAMAQLRLQEPQGEKSRYHP